LVKEACKIVLINVVTVVSDREQLQQVTVAALRGGKHIVDAEADLLLRSRWGLGYPPLVSMFFLLAFHAILGGNNSFARQSSVWILFALNCGAEVVTDAVVIYLQREVRHKQSNMYETFSDAFERLQQPWQHVFSPPSSVSSSGSVRDANVIALSKHLGATCGLSTGQLSGIFVVYVGIWTSTGAVGGTFAA